MEKAKPIPVQIAPKKDAHDGKMIALRLEADTPEELVTRLWQLNECQVVHPEAQHIDLLLRIVYQGEVLFELSHGNAERMSERYRDCTITYDPPPIPTRAHDWEWVHDGYDGPGDPRSGTAASVEAARQQIDEVYEEDEDHYC